MARTAFCLLRPLVVWSATLAGLGFIAPNGRAAPVNDNFANAIVIEGTTNSVTGSNVGATSEPREPYHTVASGLRTVWWSWTAPFTGSASISTLGSTFDTGLGVYTGNTVSNLTRVASNDDVDVGPSTLWSRVVFRAHAGETFRIAVDGSGTAQGSIRLNVGPAGTPFPDWVATNVSGGMLHPADFTNQVLVVDFWETTCQGCIDEMPGLAAIYKYYHSEGFSIVGMTKYETDAQYVRNFVEELGVTYPVAFSPALLETNLGGLAAVPTKYLVDREGKWVVRFSGAQDTDVYDAIIRPLLRASTQLQAQIRLEAGEVSIVWPAAEFGWIVEYTDDLASNSWTPVATPPQVVDNENTVVLPALSQARFCRLRRP